ncbi:hypothetical protein PACTADRAFT_47087 [Pachysolen tannophilus NRRL Y-2460]|uniref:AMP-dependent synthetase/ligase domain-containing protein n=1 Tax=Pachysolen tannophilus NRRL Y-2460 TaxID=669874 RepID=A0A1E4TP87_PACTA|nr:hypothetical protein PACTADRAFT_47087 [Pachysolen tannophilus NRRL Y-2460]
MIDGLPLPFEQTTKSIALPDSEEDGFSPIFRNNASKENLISVIHPKLLTAYDLFENSVKEFGDFKCIGKRLFNKKNNKFDDFFTFKTYREVQIIRNKIGSGALHLMSKYPEVDQSNIILSLYSPNRIEWLYADLACHAFSIADVALYDTLGPESSKYILTLTKSPIIILAKDKIQTILNLKTNHDDLSTLKVAVSMDVLDPIEDSEIIQLAREKNVKLYDFDELIAIGGKFPSDVIPPTRDTIFTISFTSGTTAVPKGCCLNHSSAAAAAALCFTQIHVPKNAISLVFLPLAHVLERYKVLYEMSHGTAVVFPHNPSKPLTFLEDIKIVKPTHLSAVPRLYNRIESGIKEQIASAKGISGIIARFAVSYKISAVKSGVHGDETYICALLNKLVINKIREKIGFANLDFLISGSAPLSSESILFLRAVLNCGFYQGYGLTESFAGIAITTPKDTNPNSCGAIGVTSEMRLRDIPEMGYSYKENRSGELLLRGPQIFQAYYKNEKVYAEATKDGWFYTGDVVKLTENGNKLIVIDRAKNFFKLSQGEYIASEKIENIYLSNVPFLNQLFIYGDSFQSFLVAVANVDAIKLFSYLKENFSEKHFKIKDAKTLEKALNTPEIRKLTLIQINKLISKSKLNGLEKIKNISLVEPFTVESGVITPTLKIKRPNAKKFYDGQINDMYEEGILDTKLDE